MHSCIFSLQRSHWQELLKQKGHLEEDHSWKQVSPECKGPKAWLSLFILGIYSDQIRRREYDFDTRILLRQRTRAECRERREREIRGLDMPSSDPLPPSSRSWNLVQWAQMIWLSDMPPLSSWGRIQSWSNSWPTTAEGWKDFHAKASFEGNK